MTNIIQEFIEDLKITLNKLMEETLIASEAIREGVATKEDEEEFLNYLKAIDYILSILEKLRRWEDG